MRIKLLFIFCYFPFFSLYSLEETIYVYSFESYKSIYPKKTILVGEIKSKVKSAEIVNKDTPIKEYDVRKDVVTVKVINQKGLKLGQKLYVVFKDPHHNKQKNALIVGEIIVTSILKHPFYGLVLTGVGNLLRVKEGYFVVRTLDSENIEKAYFFKRKGDNYFSQNDFQNAIKEYLNAIQQDNDLVEAHYSLGKSYYLIYKKDNSEIYLRNAEKEFYITWNNKDQFRYKNDFYNYTKDYFSVLLDLFTIEKFKNSLNSSKEIENILNRMEEISNECLKLSTDIECKMSKSIAFYYKMLVYSDESNPENRKKYDEYKTELGLLLKEIEEYMFKENYKKFLMFRNGEVDFHNVQLDLSHFEYIFIQYYYKLYKEIQDFSKWKEKEKLKKILLKHIDFFFILTKDDHKYHDLRIKIFSIKNQIQ